MNSLNHRQQLALTAVTATLSTVAAFSAYNAYSSFSKRKRLADDVKRGLAANPARELDVTMHPSEIKLHNPLPPAALESDYDETLIREHLSRNYSFFGDEAMAKIRKGRVAVIGLGGVGSHAAIHLARSGVQYLRLVDFDQVTLSSLNRHACATLKDVGISKVACTRKLIQDIGRWVEVDARVELWEDKFAGHEMLRDIDWVVDAIDNIDTKVDLIKYCHANGIKIISSSGSALKSNPSMVAISDLSKTSYDPLARAVRFRLRKAGIVSGIPVVYSSEHPDPEVQLLPLPEEEYQNGSVTELSALERFRVRILPVLGALPAVFGCHIATYVLSSLAGKPLDAPPIQKKRNRRPVREGEDVVGNDPIDLDGSDFSVLWGEEDEEDSE